MVFVIYSICYLDIYNDPSNDIRMFFKNMDYSLLLPKSHTKLTTDLPYYSSAILLESNKMPKHMSFDCAISCTLWLCFIYLLNAYILLTGKCFNTSAQITVITTWKPTKCMTGSAGNWDCNINYCKKSSSIRMIMYSWYKIHLLLDEIWMFKNNLELTAISS